MQGDDSKEGKDSKRLSRAELLEMLIEQSKEVESLKKKVDELQKQLMIERFSCSRQVAEAARIKRHIQEVGRSGSIPIHRVSCVWSTKECRVPGASPEDT